MTVNGKGINGAETRDGNYVVAGIDMSDLFPAPFPTDVQTVHLETLSLAKLLAKDEVELRRIYEKCKDPGFFQLDLTDDEQGIPLLKDAVDCARLMQRLLPIMSVEEKMTYKQRNRVGVYSMGYALLLLCISSWPLFTIETDIKSTRPCRMDNPNTTRRST